MGRLNDGYYLYSVRCEINKSKLIPFDAHKAYKAYKSYIKGSFWWTMYKVINFEKHQFPKTSKSLISTSIM